MCVFVGGVLREGMQREGEGKKAGPGFKGLGPAKRVLLETGTEAVPVF